MHTSSLRDVIFRPERLIKQRLAAMLKSLDGVGLTIVLGDSTAELVMAVKA